MAFTTFDPATVINATLSGGNLIATRTGIGGAKAVHPKIAGKWYCEMTAAGAFTSSNIGILNGTQSDYSSLTGVNPSGVGCVLVNSAAGTIAVNGVSSGISLGAYSAGGLLCFALDLDTPQIWARLGAAGNWNANAANNPATGVGGISVATVLGKAFYALPGVGMFGAASCTANFGASAFSGAVPAGYNSGWTDGVTAVSSMVDTQIGAEAWASTSPNVQVTQIGEEAFIVPNPAYQLTQAGSEVWLAGTPQMQLTQAGLEMWATVASGTVQMVLTQCGLEVWRSVADAPVPGHGGSMITVIL